MDSSPQGFSVHGILQARVLEWVAMPSSRRSSQPGDRTRITMSPALAGGFFSTGATWEASAAAGVSHSVVSDSLRARELRPSRLFYP